MSVPANWQPTYDEPRTRRLLNRYEGRAHLLPEDQQEELQRHAEAYGIPYYPGDFSILEAVRQAGAGFIQGLTTLKPPGEGPKNEFTAIARNLGHLAGFAPGIMAAPLRAAGVVAKSTTLLKAAHKISAVHDWSIPMQAAKYATKGAKKLAAPAFKAASVAQAGAVQGAAKVISSGAIAHMAEGAFHLGVASGVSHWQEGIDAMMHAGMSGAAFGGFFRGIGNLIKTDSEAATKAIKTLAGSMAMGLPETMRGATTPEQVYGYLLGAYFGGKELPWTKQKAVEYVKEMEERGAEDIEFAVKFDPEAMPKWTETPAEVQKEIVRTIDHQKGTTVQQRGMGWALLEEHGLEGLVPLEEVPGGFKSTGKIKDGELQLVKAHPTLHHGISLGEAGIDSIMSSTGAGFGVPFITYTFKGNTIAKGTHGKKRPLTKRELSEANESIKKAKRALGRDIKNISPTIINKWRTAYHAVKYANGVYVVGTIEPSMKSVYGGKAWAVQMAIQAKKPVHVYDEASGGWFEYNYTAGNFVPTGKVPKLTSRFLGIGATPKDGIGPTAAEAVRELFAESMDKPAEDKPIEVELDPEIETPETIDASKPLTTGKQLDIFEKTEGAPEMENEGQDVGNKLQRQIGNTAVKFINEHMKDTWVNADPELQADIKAEFADKLSSDESPVSIKKFMDETGKTNRSEEWADAVQDHLEYNLDVKARREMRRWMTLRNTGKPVRFFSAVDKGSGGIDIGLMPAHSPYSKAGMPKNMREPEKAIEEAYIEAGGERDPNKPMIIIMDHVTVKDKNGNKDLPLSRYRTFFLPRQAKGPLKKQEAEIRWNTSLSRIFGFNDKKNDMYAFGGAGDKDRLYFIKYHPGSGAKDITTIKNTLGSQFSKEYDLGETAFVNAYGMIKPQGGSMSRKEARDMYRKAYASNLRYDLAMNGLEMNTTNIKKLAGDGFIHGATAYNKRLQIYMTSGYKHSNAYVTGMDRLPKEGSKEKWKGPRISDLTDDKYKYQIIEEKPDKFTTTDTTNDKMPESTDGAIIVRDDVIDVINADFGNIDSGQNKSFIISKDAKHGALLGKFMFHAAGKKQSADMVKKGLHFKVYDSSAKQKGTRKYNTDYFMNPSDIRGGGSTAASEHMFNNQKWIKQLFTSLSPASYSPASKQVIDDIYDTVIKTRFEGETKWNTELSRYLRKPTSNRRKALISNINRIGVEPLLKAITKMNGPDANRFSELAYSAIVKQKMEMVDEMTRDGELEVWEAQEAKTQLHEFNSATDNMLKNGRIAIEKARNAGKDVTGLGIFLHKHVRDWRMATMRNWIVNQVTRPKMKNSSQAFMRPYDEYLIKDADGVNPRLKELNTRDDIFFLDEDYRKLELKTSILGKKDTNLGELWDAYEGGQLRGANIKKAEALFEAVAVRVPMDSMSGAQVLKFQGFTGRKGHGVLLHGRAMRAMGGADLDGDEAFIYFGDEAHGMKRAWKDVFKANKDEYLAEDGKTTTPSKTGVIGIGADQGKTFKDVLTLPFNQAEADLQNSKAWQWSPFQRVAISQRAVEGRNQLATTASAVQVMRSAYSALMSTPRRKDLPAQTDSFTFTRGRGNKERKYRITYRAKTNPDWQKHQRELTRAMVAYASDPLDELGLRGDDIFLKKLWTSYFHMGRPKGKETIKAEVLKGNKYVPTKDIKSIFDLEPWELRADNGIVGDFFKMNSAYFGRNWTDGKKWSISEIKEKGHNIYSYTDAQKNTILPKMVEILQPVDWNDSIFARVDPITLREVYARSNNAVGTPEYESLRQMMGRSTLQTPDNDYVSLVNEHGLWNFLGRESVALSPKLWKSIIGNLPAYKDELSNVKDYTQRLEVLEEIAAKGEHFLVNDLTDIISIKRMGDLTAVMTDEERAMLPEIHKFTEQLKARSYIAAKSRRRKGTFSEPMNETDKKKQEIADMLVESDMTVVNEDWYRRMRGLDQGDERSAEMDQAQIDTAIRGFKANLTPKQKSAFDFMMLGSLNRGPLEAIEKLEAKLTAENRWDPLMRDVVHSMKMEAAKTSLSRLAYNSKAIHPSSVQQFMLDFSEIVGEVWRPPVEADIKIEQELSKQLDKIHEVNGVGQQVEIPIEPTIDPKVEGSEIADMSHFEGLRKGTLTKEQAQIITEITGHLKHYNGKVAQDLNAIVRGLVQKDLNVMNMDDFRIVNNYFRELRSGTIWDKLFKQKGPPDMKKINTYIFPETMDRSLMKDEIIWLKRKGLFGTKEGKREGNVLMPTHYQSNIMEIINRSNDFASLKSEEWISRANTELLFLDGLTDGEALRSIAVAARQKDMDLHIKNNNKDASDSLKYHQGNVYTKAYNEALKKYDWDSLKDKEYSVNIKLEGAEKTTRETMTGSAIVDRVNKIYTEILGDKGLYELIAGKKGFFEKEYVITYYDEAETRPRVDYEKWIRKMEEDFQEGRPIDMDIGIDGLRKMALSMMIEMTPTTKEGLAARKKFENLIIDDTGRIDPEKYWPHMFFDKKLANNALLQAIEYVRNSEMPKEQMEEELKRLGYKHKQITGDWGDDSMLQWQAWNETLDNIGKKRAETSEILNWYNANQKMGSMHSRDSHIPGWSTDATVLDAYIRNLMGTYYKQFSQIMARKEIRDFELSAIKKGWHKIKEPGDEYSLMQRWSNWYKLYVQDSIGNPTVIPDRMLNDPKMKLQGTAYAWWADNRVRDKANKVAKFLGINNDKLPENLQGITLNQMRHWSNLEAKYSFVTLLTHPKTIMANLFGGSMHTIQSAGFQNFRDARNPKWLKQNIPEVKLLNGEVIRWDSIEDVKRFINFHGVLPEFLAYEAELSPDIRTAKTKEFVKDVTKLLMERPDSTISELRELNRKHRITEASFKKVANIFMGKPERTLRRDSFMAHYVHAWKRFGGAIRDPNHPFLIELAKRGVKATQFLYNAPNRPPFSRSALGKVMTRFQLWAWNAARFRVDVNRQMNIYGYRPGSEAYEKYRRQMGIDLFMVALANVFMFSMFDNQLPAPWNWLQDTADWMLGDEKERDKAFFGAYPTSVAPLQLVTPPIARMGPSALRGWLDDDWGKFADYQLYSMFPFGRMVRDITGKGNLIENPYRAIEKVTGFPFIKMGKQITGEVAPEEEAPGFRGLM